MGDYFDFLPNYTGPWLSDGKFQGSVAFGKAKPKNDLDELSRLHDSAYARWDDRLHRTVADLIYDEEARELSGFLPSVARNLVVYGNHTARSASRLYDAVNDWGPFGVVVGGSKNALDLEELRRSEPSIRKEIQYYYGQDPIKEHQSGRSKRKQMGGVIAAATYPGGLQTGKIKHGTTVGNPKRIEVGQRESTPVIDYAPEKLPGLPNTFVYDPPPGPEEDPKPTANYNPTPTQGVSDLYNPQPESDSFHNAVGNYIEVISRDRDLTVPEWAIAGALTLNDMYRNRQKKKKKKNRKRIYAA